MIMIYLLFAMSIFFIRILAGYDSRFQTKKYISVKSPVLSVILLDSMSIYGKTKRLKKDKNKMAICGIPFYLGIGIVLIINIIFLIIPNIPTEPWGIETNKFIVFADTLNDKISAIAILMLFLSVIGYTAISIIHFTKEVKPKWVKFFILGIASLMLVISASILIYFSIELIYCFAQLASSL